MMIFLVVVKQVSPFIYTQSSNYLRARVTGSCDIDAWSISFSCNKFEFWINFCRSVYSIGCGEGGKLGHGCEEKLRIPRMIKHFQTLKAKPVSVSAGAFHCTVLTSDGRVFTWGRNPNGCLGHGDRQHYTIFPTAVASLARVKARYVSAGFRSTFVVSDNGHVYSFGCDHSDNLGVEV